MALARSESDDAALEGIQIGLTENYVGPLLLSRIRSPWTWSELAKADAGFDLPREPFDVRNVRVRDLLGEGLKLDLSPARAGVLITLVVRGSFQWIALCGESLE